MTRSGKPPMARRRTLVDDLMAEVILYGGLPARRADVYADALKRTGSTRAADLYAFGKPPVTDPDVVPLTAEELEQLP